VVRRPRRRSGWSTGKKLLVGGVAHQFEDIGAEKVLPQSASTVGGQHQQRMALAGLGGDGLHGVAFEHLGGGPGLGPGTFDLVVQRGQDLVAPVILSFAPEQYMQQGDPGVEPFRDRLRGEQSVV